jgi:hypothetical protein
MPSMSIIVICNLCICMSSVHYVSADMRDWDEYSPGVEFALNSAYHEAIQSTPFRMNRITVPCNPFQVLLRDSQQPAS